MSTLHSRVVHKLVEREMASDPAFARCVGQYRQRLEAGFFDQCHVTKFVQRYEGQRTFSLEEAYAFSQCHALCLTGQVLYQAIEVGVCPGPDDDHDAMNAVLGDLPGPFRGVFLGSKMDDDGRLEWSGPIRMNRGAAVFGGDQVVEEVIVPPGSVPLEVGTTQGSRSLTHLRLDGGMARWPYGSEILWVFKTLKPFSRED